MDTAEDLALHHKPLSSLFEEPASTQEWMRCALTGEQLEAFDEQGFIAGVPILDEVQVETLREQLLRLVDVEHPGNSLFYEFHLDESEDPGTVLFHALGGWRIEVGFHDLLYSPAARIAAYQLLGAPVRFFHDQLFVKPPRHGGVVSWHQDFSYWQWTQPMAHLTCWIALDDATTENGCLHYVPGSHRWGLLPVTGLSGDMESVKEILEPWQVEVFQNRVPVELKAGEAVLHHPLVMHGSFQNRSSDPRRGAVINFAADGVWSHPGTLEGPGSTAFPVLPEGEKLAGTFYPLIFDPERELGGDSAGIHLI